MSSVLVQGGVVVGQGVPVQANVLVQDGVIVGVFDRAVRVPADEIVDATDKVVLAGAVDGHSHFMQNDPEVTKPHPEEFEGFEMGGRGAAAGGITTTIEMPQSDPPAVTGRIVRRKQELAKKDAVVDFALWGGIIPGTTATDLDDMQRLGVVGFKAFMCDSDEEFPGLDDAQLLAALETLSGRDTVVGLHAENHSLLTTGIANMRAAGGRTRWRMLSPDLRLLRQKQ